MRIELLKAALLASAQPSGRGEALFENGDIVKAFIAQTGEDGQLQLRLGDGSILKALSAPGMNLMAGERLVLQVCREENGKTQMKILARDTGAARAVFGEDAGRESMTASVAASFDNGARAENDRAVRELSVLVARAPKLGKALQQMMQAFTKPSGAAETPVPPRVSAQGSRAAGDPAVPTGQEPITPADSSGKMPATPARHEEGIRPGNAKLVPEQSAPARTTQSTGASLPGAAEPAGTGAKGTGQAVPEMPAMTGQIKPAGPEIPAEIKQGPMDAQAAKETPAPDRGDPLQDSGAENRPFSAAMPDKGDTRAAIVREIRALFVRPDAPDFDGESLKRQIETQFDRMAELGQKAALSGTESKAAGTVFENYSATLRQLQHIQQFTYLQFPVMLREKESTAELYVFRRDGRGKPIEPGATVVMLSLDTQHMGRVESVVRAENRSVHIRMRVENERVAKMFESKAAILDRELAQAGYSLTRMACSVADAPATPQDAREIAVNLLRDGTRRLDVVI